jgi:hypothetical protein
MPRALLLALALLQAVGVLDVVRRAACEEACRRDGCDGSCTPDNDCPQCPCHGVGSASLAASIAAGVTAEPVSYVTRVSSAGAERRPASPDPREILHIPRRPAG